MCHCCPLVATRLAGVGSSWRLAAPLCLPSETIIRDTLGWEGCAECSEHPQAEQMLHQAPTSMGVIAVLLGVLGRPA